MITIQRILCPIDFSEYSRHALDHAAAIGKWYGASLTVLHVVSPVIPSVPTPDGPTFPPIAFTPEDLEQFRAAAETFVAAEIDDVPVTSLAREGSIVGEILRLAEAMPADLLVIGTHGRSGFEHLMLGSVTERVLRKATCPVLTVPSRAPDAVSIPPAFKRIVCGVDFSPSSIKALTYAVALAEEADAALTVLHVHEHHVFEAVPMGGMELPGDVHMRAVALQRLKDAIASDVRLYADVHERVLIGKPYREILRQAEEQRAELIVIGAHGGGVGAAAFGSTTNQVVRQASCPVLSLRA
jgi:nucleotide-binding universal stress UspA family protein